MDIQIRRVRRRLLWERAYEARTQRGHEKITERAKTPEPAQALVEKRCFAKDGLAMTNPQLQIEVRGDLIIITHPATQFFCRLCEAEQSVGACSQAPHRYRRQCVARPSLAGRQRQGARAGGIGKATGLARLSPISFWSCCYVLAFADQCVGVLLA